MTKRQNITLGDFRAMPLAGQVVFLMGRSGSGKTTLAAERADELALIPTDDFLEGDLVNLEALRLEIAINYKGCLVEGIGCYRYLRRAAKKGWRLPDKIFNLVVTESELKERGANPDKTRAQHKGNLSILKDFLAIELENPPAFYDVLN